MIPYILLVFFLFYASFLGKNKWLQLFSFLVIFIFTAFRAETVGTDTKGYIKLATYFSDFRLFGEYSNSFEFAFQSLLYLIKSLGLSPVFLQVFFAIITLSVMYRAFQKASLNPVLSFFLYVICGCMFFSFNAARQMTSISFVLLSYTYISNNIYKYILCFVFAAGFHISSLICFPFFLLSYFDISRVRGIWLIIISFFANIFLFNTIYYGFLERLVAGSFYAHYLDVIEKPAELSFMGKIFNLLNVILFCISLYFARSVKGVYISIFVIACALSILFSGAHVYVTRLFIPMSYVYIIFYANVFCTMRNNVYRLFYAILFIFIYGYSFYYSMADNAGGIMPYKLM